MDKPVIRITKAKGSNPDHPELIYNYWLFLPYDLWELQDWQKKYHWRDYMRAVLATSNPNDCLASIICHDIENRSANTVGFRLNLG